MLKKDKIKQNLSKQNKVQQRKPDETTKAHYTLCILFLVFRFLHNFSLLKAILKMAFTSTNPPIHTSTRLFDFI